MPTIIQVFKVKQVMEYWILTFMLMVASRQVMRKTESGMYIKSSKLLLFRSKTNSTVLTLIRRVWVLIDSFSYLHIYKRQAKTTSILQKQWTVRTPTHQQHLPAMCFMNFTWRAIIYASFLISIYIVLTPQI